MPADAAIEAQLSPERAVTMETHSLGRPNACPVVSTKMKRSEEKGGIELFIVYYADTLEGLSHGIWPGL